MLRGATARLVLVLALGLSACGSDDGARGDAATFAPATATATATAGSGAGDDDDATANPNDTTPDSAASDGTTSGAPATTTDSGAADTMAVDADTGERRSFMMNDPLVDSTLGEPIGGTFGPDGWTTTDRTDRLYWELPRLVQGSAEFTVTGLTIDLMPLRDHEIFAMYDGGHGIEHPIDYNPEFRVNHYKSMIRIYGQQEVERIGEQKLMWGLCPAGAPGYIEGDACACANNFFEEPFGGDPSWDGTPQRLRVEWDASGSRYYRNDALVLDIDASASGLTFGPQTLYASLGNPRPNDVGDAGMPVGITFSDVVIEGILGAEATCG